MILIDKHNYEMFLLDLVEGNLSAEKTKALYAFLLKHPEIDFDVFDLDEVKLEPRQIHLGEHMHLKRNEIIPELSMQNTRLIGLMENTLSDKDKQAAETLILEDETAAMTFSDYQNTKLLPNTSLVYPDKGKLKKKTPVFILALKRYAAVAAIFIGVLIPVLLNLIRFDHQYIPGIYIARDNYSPIEEDFVNDDKTWIGETQNKASDFIAQVDKMNTKVDLTSNYNGQDKISSFAYDSVRHIPRLSITKITIEQNQHTAQLVYHPEIKNSFNWKDLDITYIREVPEGFNKIKLPKSKDELDELVARFDEKYNPIVKLREAKEEIFALGVEDLFKQKK